MDILDNKESKNQDFFYSFFYFLCVRVGTGAGGGRKWVKNGSGRGEVQP